MLGIRRLGTTAIDVWCGPSQEFECDVWCNGNALHHFSSSVFDSKHVAIEASTQPPGFLAILRVQLEQTPPDARPRRITIVCVDIVLYEATLKSLYETFEAF